MAHALIDRHVPPGIPTHVPIIPRLREESPASPFISTFPLLLFPLLSPLVKMFPVPVWVLSLSGIANQRPIALLTSLDPLRSISNRVSLRGSPQR